jgi:hypothetical protein
LDVDDHRWHRIHPGRLPVVFRPIHHRGHILQAYGRAILVRDDDRFITGARQDLIVGANRVRLPKTVEVTFCLVDVRLVQRRPQILHAQAVGGERRGIHANAHRRLLAAANAH